MEYHKPKLWHKSDINGFFGLFTNNLTNILVMASLLTVSIGMPSNIVFGRILPAVGLSIFLSGLYYTWMGYKLAKKEGRDDVTALPSGTSVPHMFLIVFLIMGPVYWDTGDPQLAWYAGLAWCFIEGVVELFGSIIGPKVRDTLPRVAMLSALAGVSITFIAMTPAMQTFRVPYIAMNPMGEIFTTPYIGLMNLAIVIVGWLANKTMPGNIPAGLVAIIVGSGLAWVTGYMDIGAVKEAASGFSLAFPSLAIGSIAEGFAYISPFLAAAIPLAIYDFLESLDNIESAEVAGDHYNVTKAMLVPGLLTLLGAGLGSPYPTIIYIGHPGWKATGARVGYGWLTGGVMLVVALLGLLPLVLTIIPLVALLPILVYISMVIGAQAFSSTEKRHIPALIIAFIPFVASYVVTQINNALGAAGTSAAEVGMEALSSSGIPYAGWSVLGSGDILVGMMLATIVIYVIDKKFKIASVYALITATLSFFGIIHASEIGFGTGGMVSLGYVVMAIVFIIMEFYHKEENVINES